MSESLWFTSVFMHTDLEGNDVTATVFVTLCWCFGILLSSKESPDEMFGEIEFHGLLSILF